MIETLDNGLLVQTACIWEASARKFGNVHPAASFEDTAYLEFLLSAAAIHRPFTMAAAASIGTTVQFAGWMTRNAVNANTNLGIIILLAPLVKAWKLAVEFRPRVQNVLDELTVEDAKLVYEAIRHANPGGLGTTTEQDVHAEPTVTLLEAMKLAADRDMIARQYANGFADVFDFGVPAFLDAFAKFGNIEAAIIDSQLRWLAEYPDSLIARKNSPATADEVRQRAVAVLKVGGIATAEGRRSGTELDKYLRSDGNKLNPGTTADLIAACLFVALRENKVQPASPFRWNAPDWLSP